MKKFRINKKSAFYSPDKIVKIFDSRGVIFFDSNEIENFGGHFTLPKISLNKSTYQTDNTLFKVPIRKNYSILLPEHERNFNHDFGKFKIKFSRNPNKCTIHHNRKLIDFDNSFKVKPYYQLIFILFHEFGHNFYKTEEYADLFAINKMLFKGFTPYQILIASLDSLSDKNYKRKVNVLNALKNIR